MQNLLIFHLIVWWNAAWLFVWLCHSMVQPNILTLCYSHLVSCSSIRHKAKLFHLLLCHLMLGCTVLQYTMLFQQWQQANFPFDWIIWFSSIHHCERLTSFPDSLFFLKVRKGQLDFNFRLLTWTLHHAFHVSFRQSSLFGYAIAAKIALYFSCIKCKVSLLSRNRHLKRLCWNWFQSDSFFLLLFGGNGCPCSKVMDT